MNTAGVREGPRKRSGSSMGGSSECVKGKDEGNPRVALKKQIGLMSGCAIIVGK